MTDHPTTAAPAGLPHHVRGDWQEEGWVPADDGHECQRDGEPWPCEAVRAVAALNATAAPAGLRERIAKALDDTLYAFGYDVPPDRGQRITERVMERLAAAPLPAVGETLDVGLRALAEWIKWRPNTTVRQIENWIEDHIDRRVPDPRPHELGCDLPRLHLGQCSVGEIHCLDVHGTNCAALREPGDRIDVERLTRVIHATKIDRTGDTCDVCREVAGTLAAAYDAARLSGEPVEPGT